MATTLFGEFSFASNNDNEEENGRQHDASDFSPKSRREPFTLVARQTTPPPPCAIGDLAEAMDQQNLCLQASDMDPSSAPSTSSDLASPQSSCPTSTSVSRLNSVTRRMQRQANVRMLSSASHARDIADLVQRMIEADDQCTACEQNVGSSEEDEGVGLGSWSTRINRNFGFMFPNASSRNLRADNRREDASRVSKKPRMRKNRAPRRCKQ